MSRVEIAALVVAICVLVNVVCVATDRFMLHRRKAWLHDRLVRLWLRIEETNVPDLPRLMARWVRRANHKVLGGNSLSFRSAVTVVPVSVLLTAMALFLGGLVEEYSYENLFAAVTDLALMFVEPEGLIIFGTNLVFDIATVAITLRLVRMIETSNSVIGAALVVLDVMIAYALAVGCLFAVLFASVWLYSERGETSPFGYDLFVLPWHAVRFLWAGGDFEAVLAFYSATTLIPTLLYLFVLAFLFISKPVIDLGRKAALHFLEVATEPEPLKIVPFRLLGIVFTVFAALAGVVKIFFGTGGAS